MNTFQISNHVTIITLSMVLILLIAEMREDLKPTLQVMQLRWKLARLRCIKYRNVFLESFAKGMGNVAAAIVYLILALIVISIMR